MSDETAGKKARPSKVQIKELETPRDLPREMGETEAEGVKGGFILIDEAQAAGSPTDPRRR